MMRSATAQAVFLAVLLRAILYADTATASDPLARSAIFAEQHVVDSAFDVHQRALELPPGERFEFLSRWLLPGNDHNSLRLQVAYSPTDPVPVASGTIEELIPEPGRRRSAGGRIVSPALDLIAVAADLKRLPELRDRVAAASPESRESIRDREALLTLIAIRLNDTDSATRHLELLLQTSRALASSREEATTPPSAGELLVFDRGQHVPELHELLADDLSRRRSWIQSDHDRPVPHRHVAAHFAQLVRFWPSPGSEAEGARPLSVKPMKQWQSASRSTAATRGNGQPPAEWSWRKGFVANVASHDDDYLYFASPLQGDYQVECDVTGFDWRETQLLVAGLWVSPVYTLRHVDTGTVRGPRPRIPFATPMTKPRNWIHYRTVVRNAIATTYFNGRLAHSEQLRSNHDPWVAVRSSRRNDGAVRNLRISGSPEIPEELNLSAVTDLHQWVPYYEGVEASPNDPIWYVVPRGREDHEIIGLQVEAGSEAAYLGADASTGTRESLLRYHRPMLEDGTIEYEFFYIPGEFHAHPALDRATFLMTPNGVRLHWLTDGPFERTPLTTFNATDDPACRRGPKSLPLREDAWNQVKFAVEGDTVFITLNGQLVYERSIATTNQRTFGLFHYSDRTTLKVRRVRWQGDWPRELPPLLEQELAEPGADFLDTDLDRLSADFQHDFVRDGLPISRFTILRGNADTHLKATRDGLLATRDGTGGYRNATVAPALQISGDFDIVAEYDQFSSQTADIDGKTSIALLAVLENATADEFYITRRHYSRAAERIQQLMQCVTVKRLPDGDRRSYFVNDPSEERAGRFRLARRGDTIYYLSAEGNSPNFKLWGQRPVTRDDIATDGLRLLTQIYNKGGQVSVVWKRLSIRAEQLAGRALTGTDLTVAQLDQQREKLAARYVHDFRTQAPDPERFYQWNDPGPWKASPDGWLISSQGTDNWTSVGVSPHASLEGDFDITIRFDASQLALPKAGKHSQVFLQVEAPDQNRTQASVIFGLEPDGENVVAAQIRERDDLGKYHYRNMGRVTVPGVRSMRLSRRGGNLTFLAGNDDRPTDQIIGQYEFSALPIEPRNVRFMLHTGGAGRTSQTNWRSLSIRADKISNITESNAAEAPGLVDSILDFFQR